jgi:hypothetical protein
MSAGDARGVLEQLHPRSQRCLTAIAVGLSYAEIERMDGCSYTAVNRYVYEGREQARELDAASTPARGGGWRLGSAAAAPNPAVRPAADGTSSGDYDAIIVQVAP